MKKQGVHKGIALAAAVLVLGTIIILAIYASSLRPYEPLTPYANAYSTVVSNINAGAGVYRERDYYVSTSSNLETPGNGRLLINPIELPSNEDEVPLTQASKHLIDNSITGDVYTRLTNSKRSEERTGEVPEVALISLEFQNTLRQGNWNSLTVYNNTNKEELVDSALIFTAASSSQATSWQEASSLYLVDGALTNHAAALMPGFNILNDITSTGGATGVLYTNRSLCIGGTPTAAQDDAAAEALLPKNLQDESLRSLLSMDISQRITGTDLLFCAPEGRETLSSIQAPVSRSINGNELTIEGGVIAVGEGATLVVGSGDISSANPLMGESSDALAASTQSRGRIELSPRSIIVDGGTLVLSDCEQGSVAINASIQVRNGGTLRIGNNVEINGNIYVFGNASVQLFGSFVLNGEALELVHASSFDASVIENQANTETTETIPGGIFIFANNTLQVNGTPLGSGSFEAGLLWMIDGDDGKEPILMSRVVHFLSGDGTPGYPLMYNDYCCEYKKDSSKICPHFGAVNGVVAPDVVVDFSSDFACVEAFVVKE